MEGDRSSIGRPWWVKVGLWGISSRGSAWTFVWLSIALGVVCMVYGFWNRWFSLGAVVVPRGFMVSPGDPVG